MHNNILYGFGSTNRQPVGKQPCHCRFVRAGGAEASAGWANQQVREVVINATTTNTFVIKKPGTAKNVLIKKNNNTSNTSSDTIRVNVKKGETVQLIF